MRVMVLALIAAAGIAAPAQGETVTVAFTPETFNLSAPSTEPAIQVGLFAAYLQFGRWPEQGLPDVVWFTPPVRLPGVVGFVIPGGNRIYVNRHYANILRLRNNEDLCGLIVHEFGHLLGLPDDYTHEKSVMYYEGLTTTPACGQASGEPTESRSLLDVHRERVPSTAKRSKRPRHPRAGR